MATVSDASTTRHAISPSKTRSAAAQHKIDVALMLAATALAALLSFHLIGHKSFWIDESVSLSLARDGSRMWRLLLTHDANMWLYYVLLHFWLKLGESEAFVRGLSALLAVAAVPGLYLLGSRLFEPRVGAIGAALLAVNPFFIRYGQEARSYTLLVLLVTVSSYFFVQGVERRLWRYWAAHGVCAALGVYAHLFGLLVLFTQLASLPVLGRRNVPWKGVALSLGATAALLLPFLVVAPLGGNQLNWLQPPTLRHLYRVFWVLTGSRPLLLFYFVFCAGALVWVWRARPCGAPARARWCSAYVTAWALLPVLFSFVFSRIVAPAFIDRYLIICLPALVLLAAAGVARLPRSWMQGAVLAVVLVLSARGLHWWYRGYQKEDWRGAVAFVLAQARAGDAVACFAYPGRHMVEYYQGRLGGKTSPPGVLELVCPVRDRHRWEVDVPLLESLPAAFDRIWFIQRTTLHSPHYKVIFDAVEADYTCTLDRTDIAYQLRIRRYEKSR